MRVGDDDLIGLTCQNLGVVSNMLGHLREARLHYVESMAAAVRSGNKTNEVMAYNNLATVCTDLGDCVEAELYFSWGIEIAERTDDLPQLARLYVNRAEPLIAMGHVSKASASLNRGAEIAVRINAQATLADEARFRGIIACRSGDSVAAEEQFARALRLADDWGLRLTRAETLEEMARMRWSQGQLDEARRDAGGCA